MTAICAPAVERVLTRDIGVRWCFRCRARVRFAFMVLDTVEPSYWAPIRTVRCERGHTDGDCGFGTARVWDD